MGKTNPHGQISKSDPKNRPLKILNLVFFLLLFAGYFSQTTVTISLAQGNGEDVYLSSSQPATNYGLHHNLGGYTGTCLGNLCNVRGLFKFDLSTIPTNAIVSYASIQLFADVIWTAAPTTGGPANIGVLERVTAPWVENTVNWNTQPPTTSVNLVIIPGSSLTAQNYTVNVTSLLQDIIWSCTNYGFKLRMQDEVNYYLALMFGSSDNPSPAKWPILTVTYATPTIAVVPATMGCNGLVSATVNTTGGIGTNNYTWNPGSVNNPVASSLVPGNYTIAIGNSLQSCVFNHIVTINPPTANYSINVQSTPLCGFSNAIATLPGGSGSYNYLWNPGAFTSSAVSNLSNGVYSVSIYDIVHQCNVSRTVQITPFPFPSLTVSPNTTICAMQTITLTAFGAAIYSWSSGGITNSIVVSPQSSTSYTVTGTNTLGCSSSVIHTVQVSECLGINQFSSEKMSVFVYPNPNTGQFIIQADHELDFEMFNTLGQLIQTYKLESKNNFKVEVSDLSGGVYFISGRTDYSRYNQKIVVTR